MHWEGLDIYSEWVEHYKKTSQKGIIKILRSGAIQLGGFASIVFIVESIRYILSELNSSDIEKIIIVHIIYILVAIGLFAYTVILIYQFYECSNPQTVENIIRNYKNSILNKKNH